MAAADRLSLGPEVRKLKLGDSFTKNGTKNFHTFRYDFKPASVDTKKVATVEIGPNNQATVTVPHVEGAGTAHTVFKGSRKPYTKECVLIIDHATGEIVLEKLHSNVQLKKTRTEGTGRSRPPVGSSSQQQQSTTMRPQTPVLDQQPVVLNTGTSASVQSKRVSPPRKQSHSPVQQYQQPQKITSSPSSPSMTGFNTQPATSSKSSTTFVPSMPLLFGGDQAETGDAASEVGFLSDSSNESSSSASGSSSDSSDDDDDNAVSKQQNKVATAPFVAAPPTSSQQSSNSFPSMPHFSQLTEDLHLSESGSDSDA